MQIEIDNVCSIINLYSLKVVFCLCGTHVAYIQNKNHQIELILNQCKVEFISVLMEFIGHFQNIIDALKFQQVTVQK